MTATVLTVSALVTARLWWLLARDTITLPIQAQVARVGWLDAGWQCAWCSSLWWGTGVAVVAWHATDVDGSWWWWVSASALVSSLVTALVVWTVAALERYAES